MSEPTFKGSADQQALAAQVYQIMVGQGTMFAAETPIRQTLAHLADFFAVKQKSDREAVATQIDAAMRENDGLFAREEHDGSVVYITSKLGAYHERVEVNTHMFSSRLHEPEHPLPIDDISVVVTTTRPALTTVEPVFISDYWQRQVGALPDEMADDGETPHVTVFDEEPEPEVSAVQTPTVFIEADADEELAEAEIVAAMPLAEAAEVPADLIEAPIAPPPTAPTVSVGTFNTMMTLPNGVQIDLRRPAADLMGQYGSALIAQLRAALESDPLRRIVSFGNDVFPEALVAGFGKNDLRRIRDYIQQERQMPLLDTEIIADLFYHNPRQADYDAFRFALNYRLSKEKDFEFVGIEGARLWATKGLPTVSSKRVKASDMGQITGYLEEGFDDSLRDQTADSIRTSGQLSHILTFFEWEYGVLPFTRALAALLPGALLPDQRTAVLRFDSPQRFTSSLVELRYPTGNRGGWIAGLEEFFHENLVPGALVTIARTAEPQVFSMTYEEQAEVEDRLLVLDEKKNKFTFANIAYFVAVDADMLVNQQRYGRLRNLKSLPMNERRKSEEVLEHVFGIIGEPAGTREEPRAMASTQDLLVAMNVLRPTSPSFLDHLLKDGDRFAAKDGSDDLWIYTPEIVETDDDDDDDDLFDDDDE